MIAGEAALDPGCGRQDRGAVPQRSSWCGATRRCRRATSSRCTCRAVGHRRADGVTRRGPSAAGTKLDPTRADRSRGPTRAEPAVRSAFAAARSGRVSARWRRGRPRAAGRCSPRSGGVRGLARVDSSRPRFPGGLHDHAGLSAPARSSRSRGSVDSLRRHRRRSRPGARTALAGVLGIASRLRSPCSPGRANDNFVPGFFINAVSLVVILVSLRALAACRLDRGPAHRRGRRLAAGSREAARHDGRHRAVGCVFGLRLAVQVPLYLGDNTSGSPARTRDGRAALRGGARCLLAPGARRLPRPAARPRWVNYLDVKIDWHTVHSLSDCEGLQVPLPG